ncbi:MAG: hypothetical protein NZ933_00665 [Bacteroidia bacterium]|nr:hypothetical protein [Bacteroidia bacterium]
MASLGLYSQPLDAPKPFHWGASWGIGGVHIWARPALAIRYDNTFFHLSPIPSYLSIGFSQPVGYFLKKERYDRPLYIAIHFHQRYIRSRELKGDTRIFLLTGIRVWLEPYLQRFFLQGGIGMQFHRIPRERWRFLPTAEFHIGGFYRPHTYIPKRFHRQGKEEW